MAPRKVFACKTLRGELEIAAQAVGFAGEIAFLDERLHGAPQDMAAVLQKLVDANTAAEEIAICVSGCGRATLGLTATTADLLLPRTMDCIDVLLTKRDCGKAVRPEGGIFLTKSWMQFTKATAICHERLIAERGRDAAAETLRKIYRGFTDFYIIETGAYDTAEVAEYLRPLMEILRGTVHYLAGEFGVLYRLLAGERSNDVADVIHIPRGGRVDIREFAGLRPAAIK